MITFRIPVIIIYILDIVHILLIFIGIYLLYNTMLVSAVQ